MKIILQILMYFAKICHNATFVFDFATLFTF